MKRVPIHLAMLAWGVVTALPLLWAIVSSFKTDSDILNDPWSLPTEPQWGNWSRAWSQANIGRYFFNSLIVVGGGLLLTMLLGSMVAYALARYEFRGNRLIYYVFVAAMFFPVFLALVPLFFVVEQLGLLGTYQGLILVYAAYAVPFTIFFLHAFFKTLPSEVAEAAFLDGCSHGTVFFRVMLPMARPGLVAVGIFNFLGLWNQYLLPWFSTPTQIGMSWRRVWPPCRSVRGIAATGAVCSPVSPSQCCRCSSLTSRSNGTSEPV
ncbi:hypothetical protein GCM10027610_133560 [Dactylosporangium cerinum]